MNTGETTDSEQAGALAEYIALRAESERRAMAQWNALALQIAISGAVFGFTLSSPHREILLLVIPLTTYMTCGRYVINAKFGHLITDYLHTNLSQRVPSIQWSQWVALNMHKHPIGHFAVFHYTGIVFPGTSCLAMTAFTISIFANHLVDGKPWYIVAATSAIVAIDALLTILVVYSLWKARGFRYNHLRLAITDLRQ